VLDTAYFVLSRAGHERRQVRSKGWMMDAFRGLVAANNKLKILHQDKKYSGKR
jgi:hypothetical protein